jgi:hypothetical protein
MQPWSRFQLQVKVWMQLLEGTDQRIPMFAIGAIASVCWLRLTATLMQMLLQTQPNQPPPFRMVMQLRLLFLQP